MQVLVDNLVINYEKVGKGKTLLLVHGWGDNLATFNGIVNLLSPKYELVLVDMPGFGKSTQPEKAWGLENYAKLLQAFIEKLNLDIYGFIGHSNGGAILIHGLSENALSAKKLVLIASAGIRAKGKIKKMALKTVSKSGKTLTFMLPSHVKGQVRQKFYKTIGSDFYAVPQMRETYKRIVAKDIQKDAANIKIPTLLIYGRDDKSTPVSDGEILASQIPNSELVVLEDVGHFIHWDRTKDTAKLIEDFIK